MSDSRTPPSETEYINTWAELAAIVNTFRVQNWIFRGVTDARHELVPKIGRKGARKDISTGEDLSWDEAAEIAMLDRFIREMRPHLDERPRTDVTAVAEHHGLATRLLDWSESPLIAAYFAVEPAGIKSGEYVDAALYGTPCPKVFERNQWGVFPGSTRDEVYAFYPPHLAARITVQRGLFTLHCHPYKPWQPPTLRKWTIPSYVGLELKLALNRAGINRATLFPDLDGIAEHINWIHKWGIP